MLLWAWCCFPVLYLSTYRGEAYHRYLLGWLPVACVLIGSAWVSIAPQRPKLAIVGMLCAAVAIPQLRLIQSYLDAVRTTGTISTELSLASLRQVKQWMSERHLHPPPARLHVSNIPLGAEPLSFLLRVETDPDPERPTSTRDVLVLSPSTTPTPLNDALKSLGWDGDLGVRAFEPGLERATFRIHRDNASNLLEGGRSHHIGPTGPFRITGLLTVPPDETTLLVVDTNVCLQAISLRPSPAPELEEQPSGVVPLAVPPCADAPRPWPLRDVFEVPAQTAPGTYRLEIEATTAVPIVKVSIFDVSFDAL